MISDDESPEITKTQNEETATPEDLDKNLSINQLKSRLVSMNVELDMKKHTKSYYIDLYKKVNNELSLNRAAQEIVIDQNKNLRTRGNKIRENFMKIKRKRLDKGTAEKYEKSEYNHGIQHNRFIITHESSNLKSVDRSGSFLDSDTKSKFKSIKISKISFPALNNDQTIMEEDPIEEMKVDRENLFEINELNENEYDNVRPIEENPRVDNINGYDDINIHNDKTSNNINNKQASKDYEALRKLSDNVMKLISYNNCGINPLATKNEDNIASKKPMTPKENVTWSSGKDFTKGLDSYLNNDDIIRDSENYYKIVSNSNNYNENNFQNFLEQQQHEQKHISLKKGLSSKYSNKSQVFLAQNNSNNFKAPRSSNSMILVKQIPATSNSSKSLRRLQIKESIIRTKLKNDLNEQNLANTRHSIDIDNQNIIAEVENVSYEILVKLGHYALIFIMGSALAAGFYFTYIQGIQCVNEYRELSNNLSNVGGIISIIGALGLIILISYLIKKNREIFKKENKLVADNCFNGIKNNLLSKRENGLQSPEIDANEFIEVYCNSNNVNAEYLKQNIMPLIMAQCRLDDSVEESNIYLDGVIRTLWRLKSEINNTI